MTQARKTRIQEVEELIKAGVTSTKITEIKSEEWGVSERQVFNYISDAKENIQPKKKSDLLKDLLKVYKEFRESDHKYKIWEENQDVISEEAVYAFPEEIDRKDWNEFIKFGWSFPDRVNEYKYKDSTGLEKFDSYCEGVRSGEIPVCKWVRLAVDRHFKDLDRQKDEDFPYYFEPKAAQHFVGFFETKLKHHTGITAGEPIIFEPWEWFVFGSIFGWLKKEKFKGYPLRRFRVANLYVPKKNGKSIISGGTGEYMMDYDGWPGAQCFTMATSQSHAMELGYRDATIFVDKSEELSAKYRVNKGAANPGIYFDGNNSFYQPITSKAEAEDGKNVHYFGPDETKDLEDFDIYDTMEEGTVSALNALILETSTAGFNISSIAYEHQKSLEKVLSGIVEDDTHFGVIYGIDKEDKEDENGREIEDYWSNLDLYKKANPNWGVSVFEDTIKTKFVNAKEDLRKRASLVCKHLNEWSSSHSSFIAPEKWNSCGKKSRKGFMKSFTGLLEKYRGQKAWGGLDLGSVSDFTAFVLVFEGDVQDVLPMFWIPKDTLENRKNKSVIRPWVDGNYIYGTDGDWTDHDFVEECIIEAAGIVDMQEVAYDQRGMAQIATHLQNAGIEITPYYQGYASMSPAIDFIETAILQGKIEHYNNPVLAWMNSNISVKEGPSKTRLFDKSKSQDKIDGMVALTMALYRSNVGEDSNVSDWDELITV